MYIPNHVTMSFVLKKKDKALFEKGQNPHRQYPRDDDIPADNIPPS
jgi:hypothetical protein